MFTSEFIQALGEAEILPEGDSLYITNNAWMLVLTNPSEYVAPDKLEVIRTAQEPVDWRFLAADEFYPEEKKFVPQGTLKAQDLIARKHSYQRVTPEGIRGLLEKEQGSIWGDVRSLDALWKQGKARTLYNKLDKANHRAFALGHMAKSVLFDLEGRIIGVNAEWLQALVAHEFSITVPAILDRQGHLRPIGVWRSPSTFGFIMPLQSCEVREDRQGRSLNHDIIEVSWYTPEEGRELVQSHESYSVDHPEASATDPKHHSNTLRLGVDVLRWHGLKDDQINTLHEDGKRAGFEYQVQAIFDALDDLEEKARKEDSTWWLDQRVHWLDQKTTELQALGDILEEPVDTRPLQKVKAELRELAAHRRAS